MVFACRGLGPLCGHLLAGSVYDFYTLSDGTRLWGAIFAVPACVSLAFGAGFLLLFRAGQHGRPAE